ncbi:hypothetical protein [Amycolatopsis sp. NPDC049159]|uniref:hypothetical protein n=1 Tax=Amycolatopsis sp. NPDC049159 TaxID=3157210 RepID=UPI0034033123
MTDQPHAPKIASKATLASAAVRAHIAVALRDALAAVADPDTTVTHPDGGPITVTAYGRTIQITTTDITDQK